MKYYIHCEQQSAVMYANDTDYISMHGVILNMFALDALTVNAIVVPECYFHLRIPSFVVFFFNTGSAFTRSFNHNKKLIISNWGT